MLCLLTNALALLFETCLAGKQFWNIKRVNPNGRWYYICSTQLGPNGRPIALVFAGEADGDDGGDIYLEPNDIMSSVNVQQFQRGFAYPLFYDSLYDDLRDRCTEVSLEAKRQKRGVWKVDKTNSADGAEWTGDPDTLAPTFPKLWRRIDKYVRDETLFDPDKPFRNLLEFIERTDERISILSQSRFTGFDNVIETTDNTVRMTVDPHDVVVIS